MKKTFQEEHPVTEFSLMIQIRKQLRRLFSRWSVNVSNSSHVTNTYHGFYIITFNSFTCCTCKLCKNRIIVSLQLLFWFRVLADISLHIIRKDIGYRFVQGVTWPTNHVKAVHFTQNPKDLLYLSPTDFREFLPILECFETWYNT